MKRLVISVSLGIMVLGLVGCGLDNKSYFKEPSVEYLQRVISQETTEQEEPIIDEEVSKDIILEQLTRGKSEHFDFSMRQYKGKLYTGLIDLESANYINEKAYKKMGSKDRIKLVSDMLLIANDSTPNLRQVFSLSDKIVGNTNYKGTDLAVNINLLYNDLAKHNFKYKNIDLQANVEDREYVTSEFKTKKKYKKLVGKIRKGHILDVDVTDNLYLIYDENYEEINYNIYSGLLCKNTKHIVDLNKFKILDKDAQKNYLMDLSLLVYKASDSEKFHQYIIDMIKADIDVDLSEYMSAVKYGDTRKKAKLEE